MIRRTRPNGVGKQLEMGWSPAEELLFVVWALNGGPLFAMEGPADEKEWNLLDKLQRETRCRLQFFVELWERSGRNLNQMWRDYYVEYLVVHKLSQKLPIQLAWGDSNRATFVHTFLDRHGSTPDEEAARFFLTLMCNSQNEKLGGPCAGCSKYFIRRTAGNTTYCSRSCGTRATAIAATKKKRAEERADKLNRVRAAVGQWDKQQRKGRTKMVWKEWVSRAVPEITPNFLTRAVNKGELKAPVRQ